jgi:hypothetical protein
MMMMMMMTMARMVKISTSGQEVTGFLYLTNVHITHRKSINISPYLFRFGM